MNWRFLILVITCLFLCQGCSHDRAYYEKVRLMTTADYRAMQLIDRLQKQNVQVFLSRGEVKDSLGTVAILFKDYEIFNKDSANFNNNAVNILNNVIALLNCYEEDVVKIQSGIKFNGRDVRSVRYVQALALDKAHKTAQYLWSQGINASFLYAVSNTIPKDSVVIVFQKFRKD